MLPPKRRSSRKRKQTDDDENGPSLKQIDFAAEKVDMVGMEIDASLCTELCRAFAISDTAKELNFAQNAIGDEGAEAVAAMMTSNLNIVSLNLSRNKIGSWGTIRLARSCRKHPALQSLNLSCNNIGDSGLVELGKFVASSACIRELVLTDTDVTFDGAVAFAESLLDNTSLLYLSVPYTLGYTIVEELNAILRRNWAMFNQLEEQIGMANMLMSRLQQQQRMRQEQWRTDTHHTEPAESRTRSIGGTMAEWSDPDQGSALLYLHLLEKKAGASGRSSVASKTATNGGGSTPRLPSLPSSTPRGTPRRTYL